MRVLSSDFLSFQPDEPYDVVLMNPPFNIEGDPTVYITHIEHAWGMLRDGGTLIAITPPNWLIGSTKRLTAFCEFVCDYLTFEEIGAGAIKASGTGVNTYLLYGEKQAESWRRQKYYGWSLKMLGTRRSGSTTIIRRVSASACATQRISSSSSA